MSVHVSFFTEPANSEMVINATLWHSSDCVRVIELELWLEDEPPPPAAAGPVEVFKSLRMPSFRIGDTRVVFWDDVYANDYVVADISVGRESLTVTLLKADLIDNEGRLRTWKQQFES